MDWRSGLTNEPSAEPVDDRDYDSGVVVESYGNSSASRNVDPYSYSSEPISNYDGGFTSSRSSNSGSLFSSSQRPMFSNSGGGFASNAGSSLSSGGRSLTKTTSSSKLPGLSMFRRKLQSDGQSSNPQTTHRASTRPTPQPTISSTPRQLDEKRDLVHSVSLALVRHFCKMHSLEGTLAALERETRDGRHLPRGANVVKVTKGLVAKELGVGKLLARNKARNRASPPSGFPSILEVLCDFLQEKQAAKTGRSAPATRGTQQSSRSQTQPASAQRTQPRRHETNAVSRKPHMPRNGAQSSASNPRPAPQQDGMMLIEEDLSGSDYEGAASPLATNNTTNKRPAAPQVTERKSTYDGLRWCCVGDCAFAPGTAVADADSSDTLDLDTEWMMRAVAFAPDRKQEERNHSHGREQRVASFRPTWQQGFYFKAVGGESSSGSENNLAPQDFLFPALVQKEGGPCGVLASVQAFIYAHLLFPPTGLEETSGELRDGLPAFLARRARPSGESPEARRAALTCAQSRAPENRLFSCLCLGLCHMLWQAGDWQRCVLVIPGSGGGQETVQTSREMGGQSFQSDSWASQATVLRYVATRSSQLRSRFLDSCRALWKHMESWTRPDGHGVVAFLYSLVLSRGGPRAVAGDMDSFEDTSVDQKSSRGTQFLQYMRGRSGLATLDFGYCTQELVNLCLTGRACSQVFDGSRTLDGSLTLRGVTRTPHVGFLTLFEHYDSVTCGERYKCPRVPVWVVCSESHYSCLLGFDAALTNPGASQGQPWDGGVFGPKGPMHLFYYDPLAKQDEEVHFTLRPGRIGLTREDKGSEFDGRPLEYVLRTKWKGAEVQWIDCEPIE